MTILVRQNIYSAFLDGEATAMEALNSLLDDYLEMDHIYHDYEGMRKQTRAQIEHVLMRMDGERATVKGYVLCIPSPSIVRSYDKALVATLIDELYNEGHEDIAERVAACLVAKERVGSLRIERERR